MIRHILCCSPATPLPLFNIPAMPLWAGDDEFVCGFWVPPTQYHFFSHWSNFQLTCSSFHCAACFPSVDMTNKSLLLPSHALSRMEKAEAVSFLLLFIPPHSKCFLTASFSIAIPSTVSSILPQSIKQTRFHHHHPHNTCCVEKMVTMSFPLSFIFSPFRTFLPEFIQLNCF